MCHYAGSGKGGRRVVNTPICDFVKEYESRSPLRCHMPGHKGCGVAESKDITEVAGADVLYSASGIIRSSQDNAALLFGTDKTLYSTEGSSLCIRAMVYLAKLLAASLGKRACIAAGRNAHKTFLTAAALLDVDIDWLWGESLLSCSITPDVLEQYLTQARPVAVYITSPDYLGNCADISALAQVCHRHNVCLLVDNAHGAYLRFLPADQHPITLGADLCCDSAHKTLPVLTGGAYLHISSHAPDLFCHMAERAMALFASTSPSYLILQSLDAANKRLAEHYRQCLAAFVMQTAGLKQTLLSAGFTLVGEEPLKLTIAAKPYGYRGDELAEILNTNNIVCEFADPDFLVLMLSPDNGTTVCDTLEQVLLAVQRRTPVSEKPPAMPRPKRALTPREAMLSPSIALPVEQCAGKILADASVSCPPAVPILVGGEEIDPAAIQAFRYYGIDTLQIIE